MYTSAKVAYFIQVLFGYTLWDATSMVVVEGKQRACHPCALWTALDLHDATLTTIPVQKGAPAVYMAK